ncbi:exopolyphosphatase [Thalassolituus sp. LLYu03]|uniref:exopolyphosphatase n=1 Tax=Thalassolituus sp. LLYu03 TaxID=3421656 RepID=UPI003D2B8C04
MTDTQGPSPDLIAAVDLGSNSFHMVVAQEFQGEIRTLEKRGQKVQLAAGLDNNGILSEDAQQRGLDCLREFAQRLQGMNPKRVSVLATNALRAARNRQQFIERAEIVLGYPIEVIAGREEARLIYLGVSHTLADDAGKRLVVDIGGGSTEFIIGERFEPLALESLHMGCVSYTCQFFPDGVITEERFNEAVEAAAQELLNIEANYKQLGWTSAVGSSGTIRAAEQAIIENGWASEGITAEGLKKLRKQMLQYKTTDDVALPGVKPERRQVFIGGLAILQAVFDTFGIERMIYSDGALREGALWDLVGRSTHENVRERTVQAMSERFYVDQLQARRVQETAAALFSQVQTSWDLDDASGHLLQWAAQLHEIGLSIAHNGFHKHGAYLLQHADMLGFTKQGQAKLSALVRTHRRKWSAEAFAGVTPSRVVATMRIARLLRLAVILNHSRGAHPVPVPALVAHGDELTLSMPDGWLSAHPLTERDLEGEAAQQKSAGFILHLS